jgi:cell division protein FtsB
MEIEIAKKWIGLLVGGGFGILGLVVVAALICFMIRLLFLFDPKEMYRSWSEYNEKHDEQSKLKKNNADQQRQIDDLKRELEELKRKE